MIWVSYCTRQAGYRHRLVEYALKKRVRFFTSEYILDELAGVLIEDLGLPRRYGLMARRAVSRIAKAIVLPQRIPRRVPEDCDDDPIVQTALSAKVDYLVTADTHIFRGQGPRCPDHYGRRVRRSPATEISAQPSDR